MTFCENCTHSEICKYQRTVETIDGNLSSLTKNWDMPDILKIQLKCEKFTTKKTPPFTCRNNAGEII